jgi:hypothetical protein
MRLDPRIKQVVLILAGSVVVLAVVCLVARAYAQRAWHRSQIAYHSESERLYRDFENRLRGKVASLKQSAMRDPERQKLEDEIFELLHNSQVGNNSQEVKSWRISPFSLERTAVALKWAKVATDEAAYMAKLHEIRRQDHEAHRMPHHITDHEVKPFEMPDGWTAADTRLPGQPDVIAPARTEDGTPR